MRKFIKILGFCLICVLTCFSFAGCISGSFVVPGITSPDDIQQLINDGVAKQKEGMIEVFKNSFNGIKIMYIPGEDEVSDAEAEAAFTVLSGASNVALKSIATEYSADAAGVKALVKCSDFSWTDGVRTYKLTAVPGENYHYTTTTLPTDASKIEVEGTDYFWFDGNEWKKLTAVDGENYHYTLTISDTTRYFYINPDDASHKYFYNMTNSYVFVDGTSISLDLFSPVKYFYINPDDISHPYFISANGSYTYALGDVELGLHIDEIAVGEPTNANLIVNFVKKYQNKLTATFINSICEFSGAEAINTSSSVDGQTASYENTLKNKIKAFSYFGLKAKDVEAGKTFIKSISNSFDNEKIAQALTLAVANVVLTLGVEWQYNIYIENFTIDEISQYIEDDNKFLGERKYLSIIYMNKNTYAPYEQGATTTLYPDECTILFENSQEGDVVATFSFKGKEAESGYSHEFNVVHDGDIMYDENGNPYKDENGNVVKYEGKDALNLEIFQKKSDIVNVLTFVEGYTTANDETGNGTSWSGIVKTFNGITFNLALINSINQTEVGGIEKIFYVSDVHDVLQIVFDKTESFNIAGIGSLALYDETQIDWSKMNSIDGDDEG